LRWGEYDGFNVTIPHKQLVMTLLNQFDFQARAVGAVNTIYRAAQDLVGTNTDVEGFVVDLGKVIPLAESGTALILGAGGAARAVAYGLLQFGWRIWIAARRMEQAQEIIRHLSQAVAPQSEVALHHQVFPLGVGLDFTVDQLQTIRLVVNTTPLGSQGLESASPLPCDFNFSENTCFYDLVYNPPETTFLRWARQQGYLTRNGLGMLIHQAALAFECWTGCRMPITPEIESKIMARIQKHHD
jgi:shikimate dehydrogenase